MTPYRAELGLGDGPVVLYAGNVGFSQSLDLVLGRARELPDVTFLINGDGAARAALEAEARAGNVTFAGYIARSGSPSCWRPATSTSCRSKAGLGRVSVPSKTYSIMAAGRPVVASIDPGHGRSAILADRGRGRRRRPTTRRRSSRPARLVDDPERGRRWAARAGWVERTRRRLRSVWHTDRLIDAPIGRGAELGIAESARR